METILEAGYTHLMREKNLHLEPSMIRGHQHLMTTIQSLLPANLEGPKMTTK